MAYAEPAELAAVLRVTLTAANEAALTACLDAAAAEIDAAIDRADPPAALSSDQLALASRVNLVRAVEWWKSNDAAFGVIGFADTGALQAPRNAFQRHRSALRPLKAQFGVA